MFLLFKTINFIQLKSPQPKSKIFLILNSDIKFLILLTRLELLVKSEPNPLTDSLFFGLL